MHHDDVEDDVEEADVRCPPLAVAQLKAVAVYVTYRVTEPGAVWAILLHDAVQIVAHLSRMRRPRRPAPRPLYVILTQCCGRHDVCYRMYLCTQQCYDECEYVVIVNNVTMLYDNKCIVDNPATLNRSKENGNAG